jgi:hypothetical protein
VLTVDTNGDAEWAEASAEVPDATDYLCFMAAQANSTVKLNKSNASMADLDMEYSTDKETWTQYTWESGATAGAVITLANAGDRVFFRGDNATFSTDGNTHYVFGFSGTLYASGNIMSLLDKKCLSLTIPNAWCFNNLFNGGYSWGGAHLLSAPRLPATKLADSCYARMFYRQDKITEMPELPATELPYNCYYSMFNETGITEVELKPETIGTRSFGEMFYACQNLKKVKVNFTSFGTDGWGNTATNNWLYGVSSTGIFECPSVLDTSTRDASHVPAGWIIVRTDAPQSNWDETDSTEASYIRNKAQYAAIAEPVVDRIYFCSDTGEQFLNGVAYGKSLQEDYFCITALAANSGVALNKYATSTGDTSSLVAVLECSTDGIHWTNYTWTGDTGETIALASVGDRVFFRGDNAAFSTDYNNQIFYRFDPVGETALLAVSGNIMSLLDKSMQSTTVPDNAFFNLLRGSEKWGSVAGLRLPATTLGAYCYYGMCIDDTSLTAIPKEIARYQEPLQNRKKQPFGSMFRNCTGLTEVNIDFMPKVQTGGYSEFSRIFDGCTNLSSVTVDFTQWSPMQVYETDRWLTNVSATGVFRCPDSLDTLIRDTSHVPEGWSVIYTTTTEGDDPLWVETETRHGLFYVMCQNFAGTIWYSYDKVDWKSFVFDGTQANVGRTVQFGGHTRVYLRKDAPNSQSAYVNIYGIPITRIGGDLSSMSFRNYGGGAISYEFYKLFARPSGSQSRLYDISELKAPLRSLGANAMTYLFQDCSTLSETMPIPAMYSTVGTDTTTYLTCAWTDAFAGCSNLVKINLTLTDTLSRIDKTIGLYRITDNNKNGMICVLDGMSYNRVNCTDIAPNGNFSATAPGLPLLKNVQARTSNTLNPGSPYVPHYTVGSGESRTLSLNSTVMTAISGGSNMVYGEVIIDCDANGTVSYNSTYFSADSDPVVQGKRNWCVYRVLGDKGKMFVVDTQDLPSA